MYNARNITEDIVWIGASDRRLALFENIFPIPRGVSYNSYLLLDEKTVLFDTVDVAIAGQFFENLEYVLGERKLDYLVVNHMEPDHCAMIADLVRRYPNVQIIGNVKTFAMIEQFFHVDYSDRAVVVKEGDTFKTGRHELQFILAPLVHWPEVMVTYDAKDKVLFSADAFGTFGALGGTIFADEVNFERDWLSDARRYYANIVGKYGMAVQTLLKKTSALEIEKICPLHGPIWRENLSYIVEKYQKWSTYEPEQKAVVILYASMYGNTASVADAIAGRLVECGVGNVAVYDVSNVHVSDLIGEIFRASHLIFASPTYNGHVYPPMANLIADMKMLTVQKRIIALVENGSWKATAAQLMKNELSQLRDVTMLESYISIKSAMHQEQDAELGKLVEDIVDSIR